MKVDMKRSILLASLLLILISSAPFIIAHDASNEEFVFSGFLLNPLDGNTYLAKMRQGYNGSWSFTLPYTHDPGEGSYINLFYILLGHIAYLLEWSLIFTYHTARLSLLPLVVMALWNFFNRTIDSEPARRFAFWLALFGSGLGWIILPFIPVENITSDFWVAEAFPFLSVYSSPHFALGMVMQIWMLTPSKIDQKLTRIFFQYLLGSMLLAVVSPFFVPIVGVVISGKLIIRILDGGKPTNEIVKLGGLVLGAGPVLLYDLWVVYTHPVLSGWTAQNITPSPPLWDILISFSPALIAAIGGILHMARNRKSPAIVLVIWTLTALFLLSSPFALSRRFISGLYIPVVGLAAIGLLKLAENRVRLQRLAAMLLFVISLPTNLIILSTSAFAIQSHDAQVFLHAGEWKAFEWMRSNLSDGALFLASPDTGLYIPAHINGRVIYGHPFETVDAKSKEDALLEFFTRWDDGRRKAYLNENEVDFLFIGPRERTLGEGIWHKFGEKVYDIDGVAIYRILPFADEG